MTQLLDDYAWLAWLAIVLVSLVVEVRRLDFRALLTGVAALAALLSGLLGAAWWLQVVVAVIAAAVLLATARPALLRALPVEERPGSDPAVAGSAASAPEPAADASADGRGATPGPAS